MSKVIYGMQAGIKASGYIVLMEPVLGENESLDEISFKKEGQCMKVRKLSWYKKLFQHHKI